LLHLFNKKDFSYITSAVKVGRGPSEIMNPGTMWVNKKERKIFIQDGGRWTNFEISLDSILMKESYFPKINTPQGKNEEFLVTQRFSVNELFIQSGKNGENLLTYIDRNGEKVKAIGNQFIDKGDREDKAYNILVQHNFTIHPSKELYAISYNFFDRITCIDSIGRQIFSLIGPDKMAPEYDEVNNRDGLNPVFMKRAYFGICSDEQYIYAKYLNKPLYNEGSNMIRNTSNIIHVFDWKGNPVAKLNLEKGIDYVFAVDNQMLIALDPLSEDHPWVIYDLSKIGLY
jgi:hypothetical protein